MAFLAAGGARGAFAREWLPVFIEEVCGDDMFAAVSGNQARASKDRPS